MQLLSLLAVGSDIEEQVNSFTVRTVLVSTLLLVVLLLIATQVVNNKKRKKLKKPLFIAIAIVIAVPSLLMSGSSVYINTISDSGGPVHWHTDIEFWVCGQEIEMRDPYEFLSNKVGTSTYHEHDDKRIHLEGVVVDLEVDASLDKFMFVTGGEITDDSLVIPTEDFIFEDDVDGDENTGDQERVRSFLTRDDEGRAQISVQNGAGCSDTGYSEVQAFLYTFNKEDDTYTQTKLEDPGSYIMRDESVVPPGDCLIVEYDSLKSQTDKICQQFGVRDSERCVEFGVSEYNPELCNIRLIDNQPLREEVNQLIEQEQL
jgi:hypothetical protein